MYFYSNFCLYRHEYEYIISVPQSLAKYMKFQTHFKEKMRHFLKRCILHYKAPYVDIKM